MTNQSEDLKKKLEEAGLRQKINERIKNADMILVSTKMAKPPEAKKRISYKTVNALVQYILLSLITSNVLLLTGSIINLVVDWNIVALVLMIVASVCVVVAIVISVVVVVLFMTRRVL